MLAFSLFRMHVYRARSRRSRRSKPSRRFTRTRPKARLTLAQCSSPKASPGAWPINLNYETLYIYYVCITIQELCEILVAWSLGSLEPYTSLCRSLVLPYLIRLGRSRVIFCHSRDTGCCRSRVIFSYSRDKVVMFHYRSYDIHDGMNENLRPDGEWWWDVGMAAGQGSWVS